MSTLMSEAERAAAWQELQDFARALQELHAPQIRAAFVIGSFPGGYFRSGQSDLDVVIILAGSPPEDELTCQEHQTLRQAIKRIASIASPYEIEPMIIYEAELKRDPHSGLLPRADFALRLLSQSQPLMGEFDLHQVDQPLPQDFKVVLQRYLEYFQHRIIPDGIDQATLPALVKHVLTLMRYALIICRQHVQYNKLAILQDYLRLIPELPLPDSLKRAIEKSLQGEPIDPDLAAAFRQELPAFQQALVDAMLRAKPESN